MLCKSEIHPEKSLFIKLLSNDSVQVRMEKAPGAPPHPVASFFVRKVSAEIAARKKVCLHSLNFARKVGSFLLIL